MLTVLLLCVLPQQAPDDLDLLPVRVSLGAEPGTARTEELLALLRTRFRHVELNAYGADVWVIDSAGRVGGGERHFQFWLPYSPTGEGAPYGPRVFLGAAVPRAIEFLELVGRESGVARAETIEALGHPAAPTAPTEWSAPALLGAHTPLAFALEQSPDAELVWRAEDEQGRPVAVVWQQHRYLFFAPTAGPAELGNDGRAALLDVVSFASGFSRYEGDVLSKGAAGEHASAELSWWLSRETVDLARCAELLAEELAGVAADVPSLRTWHADRGFALLPDDEGRLAMDPDLEALGGSPADDGFVGRVLGLLEATTLAERDLARRLVLRHVADGPGAYASFAEWRDWLGESAAFLVFCHAEHRWRVDHEAQAKQRSPASWPPRKRPTGRLALEEAPVGASAEELVAWLVSVESGGWRSVGWMDPALARIVAVPLATALETTVDAQSQVVLKGWIRRLGGAVALIDDRLQARAGQDATTELRAIAEAQPKDAAPLLQAVLRVAHDRQAIDIGKRGWTHRHPLTYIVPHIARAIETSDDPGGAAELAVDLTIASASGERSLAADVLASVAAECKALRHADRDRLLEVLCAKPLVDAETVAPSTLARLIEGSGDPRRIETLDAMLTLPLRSGRSIVPDVAPAYLSLGPEGIDRFESVLSRAVGTDHVGLIRALVGSDQIDDSVLEACLQDESGRAVAYAVLGQSPPRWNRWSGRLREAALGPDPAEALLAVASLGNLAEHLREAVVPLAEALAHASPWVRRSAAFELGSRYRDVRAAEGALVRALDDSDAWVQHLAAWALREPRGVGEDAAARRLREIASGNGALSKVAGDALQRRSPDPAWRIRQLRAVRPPQALDAALSLESKDPASRWKAAQNLALSDQGGALLDGLLDADASVRSAAHERIRRIDHELRSWLADLCAVLDEEAYGGPATDEFSGLGTVGLAHLEHELMRPYRFPIGSVSYIELLICLERIGAPAWPVLAASHWHWREHGFADAAPVWESVAGDSAGMLAPFLAMRLARDSSMGGGFQTYADPRSDEVVEKLLRPMWNALRSDGVAALDELAKHPLADVRAAASRVRP